MPAWDDRFAPPDPAALCRALAHAPAFVAMKERLDALDAVRVHTRWMGVPWRWTLVYQQDDEEVAFLVPDPARPLIAMPIALALLDESDLKRLARPVRDGLARARIVGDVAWAEWELTGVSLATDLARLLRRRARQNAGA